ncbi:MAG TPA: hypothetical protein H9769_12845 [Candidatus Microbacterium pullistercoris]|nr:hypothetical protein [Candidatus Microbacterium pullistercoris]
MTDGTDAAGRSEPPRRAWARAIATAAEVVVLGALLMVDFEIGSRAVSAITDDDIVVGAVATAFVAIIVAVLAFVRRMARTSVVVAAGFAVSLAASVVAVWLPPPTLALTEGAALVVLTVSGVRAASSRGAIVVGAAALAVGAGIVLLRVEFDAAAILLVLLVWGAALASGIVGRYRAQRRESAVEEARRAERMELARELHDVVAHQVTGIVVQAQAAIAVARTDPARATEGLAAIESAGSEALAGMRRMVGAMRNETDRAAPLTVSYEISDIPALVKRFDPEGERATLQLDDLADPLPPGVAESAYRVVREALTNVRRHAPEGTTHVSVRVIDAELVILVTNDGVRVRASDPRTAGFGLTGMAERVAALGGTMHAGPDEPGSWTVRAALPLEQAT